MNIICISCGVSTPKRGNGPQKYCETCSAEANLKRQRTWAQKNPLTKSQKAEIQANRTSAQTDVIETWNRKNAESARSIDWMSEPPLQGDRREFLMRQPKHILLIDSNETSRSVRCFMLRTDRFRITCASCPEEAAPVLAELQFDLVIGVWPIGASFTSLAYRASAPSLLICEELIGYPPNLVADSILLAPLCTSADIIARAKMMCARKRGPRSKKMPASDIPLKEAVVA